MRAVLHDTAVLEEDDPLALSEELHAVGDQHHRLVPQHPLVEGEVLALANKPGHIP